MCNFLLTAKTLEHSNVFEVCVGKGRTIMRIVLETKRNSQIRIDGSELFAHSYVIDIDFVFSVFGQRQTHLKSRTDVRNLRTAEVERPAFQGDLRGDDTERNV